MFRVHNRVLEMVVLEMGLVVMVLEMGIVVMVKV